MSSPEKKTPQDLDEEELREIEADLSEVVELMAMRKDRTRSTREVEIMRGKYNENKGDTSGVYHITGSHHIPTTRGTKWGLDYAEALKTRVRLGKHALELEDTLRRLTERYVDNLERQLDRQLKRSR